MLNISFLSMILSLRIPIVNGMLVTPALTLTEYGPMK